MRLVFAAALFLFSSVAAIAVNGSGNKTLNNLYHHIQDHCPLVDREMAETVQVQFVDIVFNTCKLGTAVEVFKGCSVPCANENWTPETEKNSIKKTKKLNTGN